MSEQLRCYVGGGTGGHILPALTLAQKWYEKDKGNIIFFTSFIALDKNLDKRLLDGGFFITKYFRSDLIKPPGRKIWLYPKFFIQVIWNFLRAIYVFMQFGPERIISTGGYVSIPVCLAGKFLGIPFDLYDVNARPGKAVIFLSRFTNNIYVTFKHCARYLNGAKLVGYPIRFNESDKIYDKNELSKKLKLSLNRKTIFILGGSQGAVFLNNIFKTWLENNKDLLCHLQVIHQTGAFDNTDWNLFYKQLAIPYIIFKYSDDVKSFYQMADIVISRAGSGTLFELNFFAKKSIVIPHRMSYTSHQMQNAYLMAKEHPDNFYIIDQQEIESSFEVFSYQLKKFIVQ